MTEYRDIVTTSESNLAIEGYSFSGATYNADGTIASATIDNVDYVFTYSAGKIATATGGGVTKTYSWSGDQLQSVVVA